MIAHLTGRSLHAQPDSLVLDVGGVGYLVRATTSVIAAASTAGDAPISVFVHTSVREDAIQLYGFQTRSEQLLFERLLTLQGVGPKVALAIVSAHDPADIRMAAQREDVALLQRVPGVGPKVAKRIVTELNGKLDDIVGSSTTLRADTSQAAEDISYIDARDALIELGLAPATAEAALRETDENAPAGERIRQALQVARS